MGGVSVSGGKGHREGMTHADEGGEVRGAEGVSPRRARAEPRAAMSRSIGAAEAARRRREGRRNAAHVLTGKRKFREEFTPEG